MRVLLDTNVVLDVLLSRAPWADDAEAIWSAHRQGRIDGYLCATGVTNLYYIARRTIGSEAAIADVRRCLASFDVVAVDKIVVDEAAELVGGDFEDHVIVRSAAAARMDCIVTRDPGGFELSPIPTFSPAEFRGRYLATQP